MSHTGATGLRAYSLEIAVAALFWSGNVVWAWHPGHDWLLLVAILPAWLWCGGMFMRSPQRLLLACAWMVPLSLEQTGNPLVDFSALIPSALLMLHWLIGVVRNEVEPTLRRKGLWLVLSWILWLAITASVAIDPGKSWIQTLKYALPLLAILSHAETARCMAREISMRYILGMGAVLVYAILFSPFAAKLSGSPFFEGDNALAGALIPVLFLALMDDKRRLLWWILSFAGLIWIFWISRGAALGLLSGVLVLAALWSGNRVLRWAILLAGLIALTYMLWPRSGTTLGSDQAVFSMKNQFSNEERMMRWELAIRMSIQNPWTGVGPGCFAPEFKHHLHSDAEVAKISYWHGWTGGAHQLVLGAAAETGWTGMVLLLAGIGMIMVVGFRNAVAGGWKEKCLLAAWMALLVHMQVEDLMLADACYWVLCWMGAVLFLAKSPFISSKEA